MVLQISLARYFNLPLSTPHQEYLSIDLLKIGSHGYISMIYSQKAEDNQYKV